MTNGEGTPQSPVSVRATAIDHARISVSWEPGPFPNGKILSFDLRIVELVDDRSPTSAIGGGGGGYVGYEAVQVGARVLFEPFEFCATIGDGYYQGR